MNRKLLLPLAVAVLGPVACFGFCFAYADGYVLGERREGVAAVRHYVEHLRDGDVDAAYALLCPDIMEGRTYTVADHREYLRDRPTFTSIQDADVVLYDSTMDGTYVTVRVTGAGAEGDVLAVEFVAGIFTFGARVCDAEGWLPDGGVTPDGEPSVSPSG